ncbi:hypothetical protein FS837_009365 [Tulasnella sp. UAMH 9824]|nr:hypothetical protein FS837_009365 [Tulasnella sp. UAMH 9824]
MPPKKAANGEKKTKSSTSAGAGGRKKGPSPYNIYMKAKLAEFKEKFPDMTHKERFKKVAEEWKTSSENPANKADD